MKTAIIGMGNMGCGYAERIVGNLKKGEAFRGIPDMELVAVTRVRPRRMEELKEFLPQGLAVYPSSDALYEAVSRGELELDAVVIATPHYGHEEQTIKAFERGLHVLCDKPAGVYSRQARNMARARREVVSSNL